MASGFFTLERWMRPPGKRESQWMPIRDIDAGRTLSDAIAEIEKSGEPGFFRITQTQRMIWAEKENGKLKLRKWHVSSAQSLAESAAAFERDGGKWPVQRARAENRQKRKLTKRRAR
jgi:hypothetical protein